MLSSSPCYREGFKGGRSALPFQHQTVPAEEQQNTAGCLETETQTENHSSFTLNESI